MNSITPGQLRQQRNQLRSAKNQRVSFRFVGPLPQGAKRNPPPVGIARELGRRPKRIEAPVATTSIMSSNVSTMFPSGPFPLRRKEYVADIAGSTTFAVTKFSVNPALTSTFPWGGNIAPNFEEYESLLVAFHYEPESSSSNTGAVIIAFDYDASDATPTTKQQMLTFSDNVRAAPWVPITLVLKVSDLRKRGRLYTRTGTVANTDIKTYDLGNVFVGVSGNVSSATIGEFWISYHFPLHTPQSNNLAIIQSANVSSGGGSVSTTKFFGVTPTIAGGLNVTASSNTLTFNTDGQYLVQLQLNGTTPQPPTITGTATSTDVTNCSSSTANITIFTVVVTSPGQTLILTDGGSAAVTSSNARIAPYAVSNA